MTEIDYTELLPAEPPEGFVSWILSDGGFSKEYLLYRSTRRYIPLEERWEDCVEVHCTACGHTVQQDEVRAAGCHSAYAPAPFGWFNSEVGESVISGTNTLCPVCRAPCETVHIGNMAYGITDNEYTTVISRIGVEGKRDRLLLTDWKTSRRIDKFGGVRFENTIWTAWVVEESEIVRINGHGQLFYNTYSMKPKQRKSFYDNYGKCDRLYPMPEGVLEGTTAENCKLDIYTQDGGVKLAAYLALWRKRPQVENLVMQGCAKLIDDMIDEEQRVAGSRKCIPKLKEIDWKAKRPHQMLRMSKDEWRSWGRNICQRDFGLWIWAKEKGLPVDYEKLQLLKRCAGVSHTLDIVGTADFYKGLNYLERQKETCVILRDYWNMAGKLDMDLDDEQVKWPKDLKKAHDKAVERYNARKDEMDNAAFAERLQILSGMEWHDGGILIRPCASAAELRSEGKILHHCVATYADRHKNGKTAIFFIRKEEEPDTPWFTLELDEINLTVRQNRGLRNCGKTPEVQEFEDRWIAHLKQMRKKRRLRTKKKEEHAA